MEPEEVERRLAAVLHADVVGYSRLTGQDEVGTHRTLLAYLDAITALIESHSGAVVNFAGDAVLAEFQSAVQALACAVAIQRDMETRNEGLPEETKLRFRIGLNLGDIIVARQNIYGDGVNVAARLESLAAPGGVCISHSVLEQVKSKMEFGYEYLGEQKVKNIVEPVRAYRVILDPKTPGLVVGEKGTGHWRWMAIAAALVVIVGAGALAIWSGFPGLAPPGSESASEEPADLALPAKPSIAVLPLKNVSGDSEQDYFSDGITEDIITDLSKFSDLFVIASNTVFTYKGKPVNVQDISRQLGVRYVLEGSVQRAGEKVRVNAQLIDGTTGHLLWAERLVRPVDDLFALQDEVVRTIVSMLATEVDVAERQRASQKNTDNLEAYDYVLQGRQSLLRSTGSANSEARDLFRRAIELDPGYASAYVALGQTYLDALRYGWTATPGKALQQVHDLAQKALSIEERNAAAHRLLGFAYLKRRQYDPATKEFERALEINPNDAESHDALGGVWLYTGRADAAIEAIETALRFNPELPSSGLVHLGLAYYLKGQYREAITTLERALGQNPDLVILHVALAAAYAQADRGEDAARAAAEVRRLHPFFEVDLFGNGFSNQTDRASIREGLVKAGLE